MSIVISDLRTEGCVGVQRGGGITPDLTAPGVTPHLTAAPGITPDLTAPPYNRINIYISYTMKHFFRPTDPG